MNHLIKKHETKLRFALVGGINTAIDIGLLMILASVFSVPKIPANVVSTTTAFIFSFFANKKYTFKSLDNKKILRELVLFTVVTLFGLWVIQGVIIQFVTPIFTNFGLSEELSLLTSKLIATVVTLIWNYLLYSRIVFKSSSEK